MLTGEEPQRVSSLGKGALPGRTPLFFPIEFPRRGMNLSLRNCQKETLALNPLLCAILPFASMQILYHAFLFTLFERFLEDSPRPFSLMLRILGFNIKY